MIGFGELLSAISILRDSTYETVYHVGDTALQFTADLVRGPDNLRHYQYVNRQVSKQENKPVKSSESSLRSQKSPKNPSEKPLNYSEMQYFSNITRRKEGESIIEHWKRRKYMLSHPRKRSLIVTEQKIDQAEKTQHSIKAEMKSISSQYQKERVPALTQKKKRGRKR